MQHLLTQSTRTCTRFYTIQPAHAPAFTQSNPHMRPINPYSTMATKSQINKNAAMQASTFVAMTQGVLTGLRFVTAETIATTVLTKIQEIVSAAARGRRCARTIVVAIKILNGTVLDLFSSYPPPFLFSFQLWAVDILYVDYISCCVRACPTICQHHDHFPTN